jgi:ATP-dependent DNA helicase RecQ
VKDIRQKEWVNDKVRVMVATNAFGMGIDKPDVRLVIHMDLPDSPEAYFQEAVRAGRDGKNAFAVLLYAKSDKVTLNKRIPDTFPDKDYIRKVYEHLNYYFEMAMGDGEGCTFAFDLDDFCRKLKHFPVQADSALKILTRAGYLEYTEEQDNTSQLLFTIKRDELYLLRNNEPDTEKLINLILRSYTGLFSDYAYINEESLSVKSGIDRERIYQILIIPFWKR